MLDDIFPDDPLPLDINPDSELKKKDNPTAINCAGYLIKPELPRGDANFVGLINQGGTCYMNSSLQVLFMNPLFRQIIYDLPLCEGDNIAVPSSFVEQGQMYQILLTVQTMFIQLQKYNIRAITTKELTEAFGWSGSEGSDQHDSQEFFRLFFEALDGILVTTGFNGVVNNLFKVVQTSIRICSNCNYLKSSDEYSLDITIPSKDSTGLLDSLSQTFKNYEIISDYQCDNCNQRVDLKKGNKISQLPVTLAFTINKMDFDFNTFERKKLTSKFDFPLEIDMRPFMREDVSSPNAEEYKYELYSIIIHRGTPYSGHYFSYIRDLNEEGFWNLQPLEEYKNEPEKRENRKGEEKMKEEEESKENENEKVSEEKSNTKKGGKKGKGKDKGNTNSKNKNKNQNKKQNKGKSKQEEEYEKLNFDECDHPIPYTNKNLSERWFCFDDTSVLPIRVGRLQKQFQSSESAYILFYMKKGVQIDKSEPPKYLLNYIDDLNTNLCLQRAQYEEELNSFEATFYELTSNFKIDEFNILSLNNSLPDLDKTENKIDLKLKFYHKFSNVISEIKSIHSVKNEKENLNSPSAKADIDDFILYEIMYKKEKDLNTIIVLEKFDPAVSKDETLEKLKFCHNSRFIFALKSDPMCSEIEKQIGVNHEPITLHIVNGADDKFVRVFANMNIQDLKNFLKNYFKLNHDISLIMKNNNKNSNMEKNGFDRKNQCWLTLKQLRIPEKALIFVTKRAEGTKDVTQQGEDGEGLLNNNDQGVESEKINCICKFDEEEDFTLVKIRLGQTFGQLIEKIKRKMNFSKMLPRENEEESIHAHLPENSEKIVTETEVNTNGALTKDERDNLVIRVRKELDGRIIYKNQYDKKLLKEEMFLDGGVRLRVEIGEPYEYHEILLKILMEIDGEKCGKEFIGDPEKTLLSDLKNFICTQFDFNPEEHQFHRTNAFGDPVKAMKNENLTLSKVGLKDLDTVFLKNISAELKETYLLKIYQPKNGLLELDNEFVFKPLDFNTSENNSFAIELNLPKDTTLGGVKELINNDLGLGLNNTNQIRLRSVNKKMDAERILKGNDIPLKKLNLDNPANLLMEILPEEENLKDNQIQLYIWKRNLTERSYYEKKSVIFEFNNNMASSDQLYELCKKVTGFNSLTIAKYAKFNYLWESIPEMNEQGPVNLRKQFNLRDGDWIGVRNGADDLKGEDDFQTDEDKKVLRLIKEMKITTYGEKKKGPRAAEKPLRMPKFNETTINSGNN